MRTAITLLAILGMTAVQAQNFAPNDAPALSGVPLTVAKRTNLPSEPASAAMAVYMANRGAQPAGAAQPFDPTVAQAETCDCPMKE